MLLNRAALTLGVILTLANLASAKAVSLQTQESCSLPQPPTLTVRKWVLSDPEARIHPEFKIPAELQPSVYFWFDVYTRYSEDELVIFDELRPWVVYEVVNASFLRARARNSVAFSIMRDRLFESRVKAYEVALTQKTSLSPEGQRVHQILTTLPWLNRSKLKKGLRSQIGQRNAFVRGLAKFDDYASELEVGFRQLGVPVELLRLGMVESSFNPRAVSRMGASGVFQFMPEQGRHYLALTQDRSIDERLSPLKSGLAAALMLRDSNRGLRDWWLAVVAYHSGMKPLRSVKRGLLGRQELVAQISSVTKSGGLGFAGKSYLPSLLAAVYAEQYRHIVFSLGRSVSKNRVSPVQIDTTFVTLRQLANKWGLSAHEVLEANPDIASLNVYLPKGLWVFRPANPDEPAFIRRSEWLADVKRFRSVTQGTSLAALSSLVGDRENVRRNKKHL